jgi:hypothetical protein
MPEQYLCGTVSIAPTAAQQAAVGAAFDALAAAFGPVASARTTFNLLGHDQIADDDAFSAPTLARLRSLKRERDPHGVLCSNHPVGAPRHHRRDAGGGAPGRR